KGLAGLIVEYNSTMRRKKGKTVPEPDSHLWLPAWPAFSSSDPPSINPLAATPLNPQELAYIQNTFELLQQRLTRYAPGLLSVEVDGQAMGEFDIQTQKTLRLRVPNSASTIEVYGHDDEGPLLLAVFSVAHITSAVVGRTVTFLLSP